jgi:protein SCO1/2
MFKNYSKLLFMALMLVSFFLNACVDSQEKPKDIQSILSEFRVYGTTPVFSGITDSQTELTSKDLPGKLWLISFFFASCGDICPKMNAVKSKIISNNTSDSLRFLSVTVDPEIDTPDFLSKHRREMKFSDKRWQFIRMKNDSILQQFMNGLLVGYSENPENHSARIILIDSKSQIRGYFDALDKKQVDSLESILRKLQ